MWGRLDSHSRPPYPAERPVMKLDDLFSKRFVVAWQHSRSLRHVARRLGGDLTAPEVRRVARRLRRAGVNLAARPQGFCTLGLAFLLRHPDGDYQDLRGRDAYRVGTGTPIEGPWTCRRCGAPTARGFCVLSAGRDRHWHLCQGCVCVLD
jgi:hypothetical protein